MRLKFLIYVLLMMIGFFNINLLQNRRPSEDEIRESNLCRFENSTSTEIIRERHNIYVQQADFWIINNRLAIYSSKIIVNGDNSLELESLLQCDYENQNESFVTSRVKFVVKYKNEFMLFDPSKVIARGTNVKVNKKVRNIFKANLKINNTNSMFQIDQIYYTLTDNEEYTNLAGLLLTDVFYYMPFHRPYIYNSSVVKKKAVAHCVHMVRFLDQNNAVDRLINWLDMQKSIGIDVIRLYMYKVKDAAKKLIAEKHGDDFVQITDIESEFKKVCKFQLNLFALDNNSSPIKTGMLENCENVHKIYLKELNWGIQTTLELLVSNDCYSRFRYTYEYVSNYDFDEFILPRRLNPLIMKNFKSNDFCKPKSNINLYDYVNELIERYNHNSTSRISHMSFNQVLVLNDVDMDIFDKLAALNLTANTTFVYNPNDGHSKKFKIALQLEDHLRQFLDLYNTTLCLNRKVKSSTRKSLNFYKPVSLVNNYIGKTIFNTNYTLMINQHYPFETLEQTESIYVSYKHGYYNHFRADLHGYYDFSKTIPFDLIFLDLELYSFIANRIN